MGNWLPITIAPWLYSILVLVYAVTIIGCIGVVLSENRNPIKSLAWVTVLIFLPVAGLIFYLFFGRSLKGLHMISRHNKRKLMNERHSRRVSLEQLDISEVSKQIVKLSDSIAGARYCRNNEVEIFTDGVSKFDALKADLRGANHSIYLQYYIFSDDSLGQEIADILITKAREGVKVNVIYDHVGSFSVRTRFFKKMRDAGVEAYPFFRVTFPQLANRINWRNHRKIVVIDGEIGYIGGMNIADRYVKGLRKGEVWRDTHFRVRGEIVSSLLYSFAIDWSFMHMPLIHEPRTPRMALPENETGIQLLTSGPTGTWPNIAFVFLKAISSARKSIYIESPYFLPTDALLNALQAAALSQVDVRIIIPRKGDSEMLRLASYSYITECLKAGIKIYLYEPGMLHAKSMIIDDEFTTSGSTNFDFRSFEHNFEANIFIYDADINRRMKKIFFDDMANSTKLTLTKWRKRPLLQRLLESILRLLSPIL